MCQVGEYQHWLAHQCSLCENFLHTHKCEVKCNGDMGKGHSWFKWVGFGIVLYTLCTCCGNYDKFLVATLLTRPRTSVCEFKIHIFPYISCLLCSVNDTFSKCQQQTKPSQNPNMYMNPDISIRQHFCIQLYRIPTENDVPYFLDFFLQVLLISLPARMQV